MMRLSPGALALSSLAAAALLAACSGGNNSKKIKTVTALPSVTHTIGASPAAGAAASGTALSPNSQTVTPPGTPLAGPSAGCAGTSASAAAPTPEAPFVAGQQPVRPAIDLSSFTVNPQYIPSGYKSLDADRKDPVPVPVADLARSTANPQATLNHLNNIGYLGGRQQGWSAPDVQNRIPTIYVLHLAFNTDAGASAFLRNPPIGATICAKPEPGPQIGQETLHFFYQYETPGGVGLADGHSIYWRCGRVVLGVNDSSAPGQATQGAVDDLARRIQADFVKTQPCA